MRRAPPPQKLRSIGSIEVPRADDAVHVDPVAATKQFLAGSDRQLLRLDAVVWDVRLQPRWPEHPGEVRLLQDKVLEYRDLFLASRDLELDPADECPDCIAFQEAPGAPFFAVEGWHRRAAAGEAGVPALWFRIKKGDFRAAWRHAAKSNRHGAGRTHQDKLYILERYLEDEEWSGWSGREIARDMGVAHSFVNNHRPDIEQAIARRRGQLEPDVHATLLRRHVDQPEQLVSETSSGPGRKAPEQLVSETSSASVPRKLRGADGAMRPAKVGPRKPATAPQLETKSGIRTPAVRDLEERFRKALGTQVRLQLKSDQAGDIIISYYSLDQLDGLIKQVLGQDEDEYQLERMSRVAGRRG